MASNRGAFETSSHRKLAPVSTSSNIPLFPLTAMLRNSLLHQSWNLIRFQWNEHRRMKIYLVQKQGTLLVMGSPPIPPFTKGGSMEDTGCPKRSPEHALGYVQSISLQLRLMSHRAGTRSNVCGQGIGLDTVGMNE
jgi:hypothetical protein